jgi:galactose mutarotase-like enzyme
MAFGHTQAEAAGKQFDVLIDETSGVRLAVARLGAEPVSIARRGDDGEWLGFLHRDGDLTPADSGWNNHSTVMGYFIHRLVNERSLYRGQEIRGGTHSFLRHKVFSEPEIDIADKTASLTYRIGPGEIAAHEYPLPVSLILTYTLIAGSVRAKFHFSNADAHRAAHISFGLHPGFAVDSLSECEVILPPGDYIRHLAPGNFLSGETQRISHRGGPMPFDKAELPGSVLLELSGVKIRTFVVRDSRREVALDYSEAPYLTLWSDGGNFICVEPCWGLPDHHNQRPFEQKLGIQEIAPSSIIERAISVTPQLLA